MIKNNKAQRKRQHVSYHAKQARLLTGTHRKHTLLFSQDRATNEHPTSKTFHKSDICMLRCSDIIHCCCAEEKNSAQVMYVQAP